MGLRYGEDDPDGETGKAQGRPCGETSCQCTCQSRTEPEKRSSEDEGSLDLRRFASPMSAILIPSEPLQQAHVHRDLNLHCPRPVNLLHLVQLSYRRDRTMKSDLCDYRGMRGLSSYSCLWPQRPWWSGWLVQEENGGRRWFPTYMLVTNGVPLLSACS